MTSGRTRSLLVLAAALAAAAVLATAGRAAWRIAQAAQLARQSEALQHRPADPALRLLIVGDSTGVGTGAGSPQASLAGLLAADHPRLWIENRARDGARLADVIGQLAGAERFDLLLVMAGGNDVIRLSDLQTLAGTVERVTARAAARADTVLLMPAGNVGNAPFFFPPLSWWMTQRSRRLHALVRAAAARHGAVYVDLFEERAKDPFVLQPGLNARDGLHPSAAGYRAWHAALLEQADLARRLAAARR